MVLTWIPNTVFDWRVKGAVSPVKVQGQGSSCWSFSSVGAIEGAVSIAKGQPAVSLSNQQIMDCSHVSCLDAINGTMTGAFENIVGWGGTLDSDKDYPYRDADCGSTLSLKHSPFAIRWPPPCSFHFFLHTPCPLTIVFRSYLGCPMQPQHD